MLLDRDAPALAGPANGCRTLRLPIDIANPQAGGQMAVAIKDHFGRLDCLVNNAGVADSAPIEACDATTWRRVMDTNLDGMFYLSQALTPLSRNPQLSGQYRLDFGLRASTLRVAYGTSKAAVMHLTQQQAVELGEYGIRANCVAPGPVRTKLAMAVHTQEIIDAYHDAIPLNRYGTEREIGEAVYFLCSRQGVLCDRPDPRRRRWFRRQRRRPAGPARDIVRAGAVASRIGPGAPAYAVLIAVRPISAIIAARILNFCGLPVTVIGKASLNWI